MWAILLVRCRPLPPNHLIPIEKPLSRWDVVWLCIHWVVQDTKQHFFYSMLVVFTPPSFSFRLRPIHLTLSSFGKKNMLHCHLWICLSKHSMAPFLYSNVFDKSDQSQILLFCWSAGLNRSNQQVRSSIGQEVIVAGLVLGDGQAFACNHVCMHSDSFWIDCQVPTTEAFKCVDGVVTSILNCTIFCGCDGQRLVPKHFQSKSQHVVCRPCSSFLS